MRDVWQTAVQSAKEGLWYGVTAAAVTPGAMVLQTAKVAKQQIPQKSYRQLVAGLVEEGGGRRLMSGYVPYAARNVGISTFGGMALTTCSKPIQRWGYTPYVTATLTAFAAAAAETGATLWLEAKELIKTKGLPKSFKCTARFMLPLGQLAYGRNTIYWGAATYTDTVSSLHGFTTGQSMVLSSVTGFGAGLVSTPADVVMTKLFGTGKGIAEAATEQWKIAGMKGMCSGMMMRSVLMGVYTAATVWAIQLNKPEPSGHAERIAEERKSKEGGHGK